MMKFIIIFGPPAVGKMSVGNELAKLAGLKLFHNHMTIDLILNFFPFGDPRFHKLVSEFRRRIFEEVAASELPGLIFTFVWALDLESDREFIDRSCDIFRQKGAEIYFVELQAELSERLRRNESEFRLSQKPPKRDIEFSRHRLLEDDEKYKLNSNDDFFYKDNYLKIENTNLSASEAALRIVGAFNLAPVTVKPNHRIGDPGSMTAVHGSLKVMLLAILFACSVSCGGAASIRSNIMSVEGTLKRIQTGNDIPAELQIIYDDMHGLWGGTTIVITGKGSGERRERNRGNAEPEIFNKSLTREQILELIKLLIEHEAWQQRTPSREPVPDESRASLTIRVNGQTSNVWEWFNDMEKNKRLSIIKAKMKQLTS
jgi:hypothetical protein